jgi:hypothetical protein
MGKDLQKREGQEDNKKAIVVKEGHRALTATEFHQLAEVPPAIEWFANLRNEKTRRAYQGDVTDFMCASSAFARPRSFVSSPARM